MIKQDAAMMRKFKKQRFGSGCGKQSLFLDVLHHSGIVYLNRWGLVRCHSYT